MRNRNKRVGRKRLAPSLACFKSAITNGSALLHDVDGRSQWMRRLRDLIHAHQVDLGGEDMLSEGQRSILRRAALLQVQLELMETKFGSREDGVATNSEIEVYQRTAGNLRRLLESLGLHEGRKARTVSPSSEHLNQLIDGVVRQHRQRIST